MERQRNFLPLAGLAVCVVAFLSYFVFFYQFPITRDVPWANWLLFAFGLGLAVVGLRRPYRQPERYRGRVMGPVLGVLSVTATPAFPTASAMSAAGRACSPTRDPTMTVSLGI